jgi:hypothetical protein
LSEFGDALGGRDRASLEMLLEAVIERLWRPRSSDFGDALGGHDRARLEEYLEAVNLVAVSLGGRRDGSGDSTHWLTLNCANVEN